MHKSLTRWDSPPDLKHKINQATTLDAATGVATGLTNQLRDDMTRLINRKADTSALSDLATKVELNATNITVNGKADAAAVTKLEKAIEAVKTTAEGNTEALKTKASTTELATLTATVQTKASTADLAALATRVGANETELGKKATAEDLTALDQKVTTLTTTVDGKATIASVTTLSDQLTALSKRVDGKADKGAPQGQGPTLDSETLAKINSIDTKASKQELQELANTVDTKATNEALAELKRTVDTHTETFKTNNARIEGKAEASALTSVQNTVSTLEGKVEGKADKDEVKVLQTSILSKVDSSEIERLETDIQKKAAAEELAVTNANVAGHETEIQKIKTAAEGYATKESVETLKTSLGDKASNSSVSELGAKVDAVTGKGLSANDLTDELLGKINAAASTTYVDGKLGGVLKADGSVSMTGTFNAGDQKIINVADSHEPTHAVNNKVLKEYLDVYMSYADETKASWDAEDKPISGVAAPTADDHAANRGYVKTAVRDILYPTADGYIIGGLPSSPHKLISLATPERDDGAATKGYVDAAIRGLNITFDGDMKHNRIRHVSAPTDAYDAANRDYVDTKVREASVTNPVTYSTTTGAAAEDKLYYNTTSALTLNRIALNTDFRGGITANYNNNTPYLSRNAKLILTRGLMDRVFKINNVDAYTSTPQGYDNVQCIIPQAPIRSAHHHGRAYAAHVPLCHRW